MTDPDLSPERRREIFRELVRVQDEGLSVDASRLLVAERFGIQPAQLEEIEREGIVKDWPLS